MEEKKPLSVGIRHATTKDIDALVSLLATLFSIETDFEIDPERQRKGLAMLLEKKEKAVVLVADDVEGKQIIGMATAQRLISTAEGGYAAQVEDVIVHEHYRRQGIGSRLMETLFSWARKNAITRLQLLYDVSNTPALLFYEGLSFKRTALCCIRRKEVGP